MPDRDPDDELIDALERLGGQPPPARTGPAPAPSGGAPSPGRTPPPPKAADSGGAAKPAAPPSKPPAAPPSKPPAAPKPTADRSAADMLPFDVAPAEPRAAPPPSPKRGAGPPEPPEEPRYRCLHCGYPLAGGAVEVRCPECGRRYESDVLRYWFGGTEEARLDHLLWLVRACLFIRLLLLPQLQVSARLGMAVAAAWGCYVAGRDKEESLGRYYGLAGVGVSVFMFIFAWIEPPLAFHTLDMIAACLLLLAALYGPSGVIGGLMAGRRAAPALLVAAPLLGTGCYVGLTATAGAAGATVAPEFIWGFAIPYVAAAGTWLFVWRTLAGLRRTLFTRQEEE